MTDRAADVTASLDVNMRNHKFNNNNRHIFLKHNGILNMQNPSVEILNQAGVRCIQQRHAS